MKPLVIFHGTCPDGFVAAWVADRALGGVELYPGEYGKEPPYDLARGRDVYVVDFSYPKQQILQLHQVGGRKLVVLDHHKTAQEDLQFLLGSNLEIVFDMNRSGASIAWDYFHPGTPWPWIVSYVHDRDLRRFVLPHSKEISLFLRTIPYKNDLPPLEEYDRLASTEFSTIFLLSQGCKRYLDHYIKDALRNVRLHDIYFEGGDPKNRHDGQVPNMVVTACVNVSYTGVSDVLDAAIQKTGAAMALGWHVIADGRFRCSLLSRSDFDCSQVARGFGGGGHAQASGFYLAADHHLARQLSGG